MIYQIVHRKLKIEQHNQILTMGECMCSGKVGSSCSTSGTRLVILVNELLYIY